MADLLERASRLIQSEGFTGAHSFIFLTRYAALQGDRALLRTIGTRHPDQETAKLEATIRNDLDAIGIAPLGFGGSASVLSVNIEKVDQSGLSRRLTYKCQFLIVYGIDQ